MIPFYIIRWTNPDGGTIDIGEYCHDFSVKKAIQAKANIANFNLHMPPPIATASAFLDSTGNLKTELDGAISVFLMDEPIDTDNSDHLLSALTITSINPIVDGESVAIKLGSMDKTAHMLSKAGAKNYSGSAPVMIRDIVKQWAPEINADLDTDGGYITTTPGGTATSFPSKDYAYVYKPIFEAVDEISQPSFTGDDRPYIFWIDETNNLHWIYPSQTTSGTITEGTDDVYLMSLTKKEQDEVNMVIYNGGKDKNDNSILWYRFNFETKSGKLKIAYYDWTEISTGMQTPGYSWGTGDTWNTASNEEVRTHVKTLANAKCEDVFARKGLYWKGKILMKGNRTHTRGDFVELVSSKFGQFGDGSNVKARITDTIHDISPRGWLVTYMVEEDPLVPTA